MARIPYSFNSFVILAFLISFAESSPVPTETNVTMTGDVVMSGPGAASEAHDNHILVTGSDSVPAETYSVSVGHIVLNQEGLNAQTSAVNSDGAEASNYLLAFQAAIAADGFFHFENGENINVDSSIDGIVSGQGTNVGSAATSIIINKGN